MNGTTHEYSYSLTSEDAFSTSFPHPPFLAVSMDSGGMFGAAAEVARGRKRQSALCKYRRYIRRHTIVWEGGGKPSLPLPPVLPGV